MAAYEFLSGGGGMGRRIREYDWSKTPLGEVPGWPQSLRSAISICLNSNFPIAIYWGSELTLLYNDAWAPIPGDKHPHALGQPAAAVWPEIWKDIAPQFEKAFRGTPGGSRNALLPMHRHGYTEECYFDFTFTPVYGEGGRVEGVFNAVIETTQTILNERQLKTLRELGNLDTTSKTLDELMRAVAEVLEQNNKDFPFGIIYKIDPAQQAAFPVAYSGTDAGQTVFPAAIDLQGPGEDSANFYRAYTTGSIVISENAGRRKNLPTGGWDREATHFIHLPFSGRNSKAPVAVFSAALNPYRRFDGQYRQFAQLITDQVSTEAGNVLASEEERRRAQALAEIDKAKTAFFTNISHEFRTPLTLMLGSLESLLEKQNGAEDERGTLETAHRNALRLLRLVNNLLDFSRIEAGKAQARFTPVDLAALTRDLASTFRSAIEAAGLQLNLQLEPLPEPAYVDTAMWEKIVLNLLSNAFKYTLQGSISLRLRAHDGRVRLRVEDTGIGIPEAELPRMFDRFHRVEGAAGRTHEGTGIGLSLVSELVRLHGGSIGVESREEEGTVFTVTLPAGKDHLPPEQLAENGTFTATGVATAFLEEAAALAVVPAEEAGEEEDPGKPLVLVADDNADMRSYIRGLLQGRFGVLTARNGQEALERIRTHRPALVLTDVMMPVMDGIGLLKAIKEDPVLYSLPVVLLSARAGEEARLEGLDGGADDYLVKPFSARELLARVQLQVNLVRKRDQALRDVYRLFDEVPFAVAALRGPDLVIDYINPYNLAIWQQEKQAVLGRPLFEVRPDIRASAEALHAGIYRTGKRFEARELPVELQRNGQAETRYFDAVIDPMRDENGVIVGQLATSIDVTEKVRSRQALEQSNRDLQFAATLTQNIADAVIGTTTLKEGYRIVSWNKGAESVYGWTAAEATGRPASEVIRTEFLSPGERERFQQALDRDGAWSGEAKQLRKDGTPVYVHASIAYVKDEAGRVLGTVGVNRDITRQREAEEKVRESERRFRSLAESLPQLVWMTNAEGEQEYASSRWQQYTGITPTGPESWRQVIHPADLPVIEAKWAESLASGLPYQVELRIRSAAGNYRWFYGNGEPVGGSEGRTEKWVGAFTDIHDQKMLNETLENLVDERTRELQRSNEDLQQFAHVASHDLKEPVRKVMTFSNRLKLELGTAATGNMITYLGKIEHAAIRMYAMIDGVLLYSSLDALEQTRELVDLGELLQSIETDLEVPMEQKSARLEYGDLPRIQGSAVLLYQLFYNLVNNALKFARANVLPLIRISAGPAGEEEKRRGGLPAIRAYTRIVVEDNGIGFPDSMTEKIFGIFTRLHPKDRYEGTGLGLSLCRKIVERHGGAIYAQGREGEGARFVILLPE